MSQTISLKDDVAALLKRQADARDLSVEAWIEELAREKTRVLDFKVSRQKAIEAATKLLETQKASASGDGLTGPRVPRTRLRRDVTP